MDFGDHQRGVSITKRQHTIREFDVTASRLDYSVSDFTKIDQKTVTGNEKLEYSLSDISQVFGKIPQQVQIEEIKSQYIS